MNETRARKSCQYLPVFSLISHSTVKRAGFMRWQLRACFLNGRVMGKQYIIINRKACSHRSTANGIHNRGLEQVYVTIREAKTQGIRFQVRTLPALRLETDL